MNDTVLAAIDRELAALEHVAEPPTGDLGWGRDLSCVAELSPTLAEVDPWTVRAIGEAAIRRLTTPHGTLVDAPDYGLDVRSFCNRGVTPLDLAELGGRARLELLDDDRIDEALVTVTAPSPGLLNVNARLTPADPRLRPFALVLAVTSASVLVEAL